MPDVLDLEVEAEKLRAAPGKSASRGTLYTKLIQRRESFISLRAAADGTDEGVTTNEKAKKRSDSDHESNQESLASTEEACNNEIDPVVTEQPKSASAANLQAAADEQLTARTVQNLQSALDLASEGQIQSDPTCVDSLQKRHTFSVAEFEECMPGLENYDTSWVNDGLSDSDDDGDVGFDLSLFSPTSSGAGHVGQPTHSRIIIAERRSSVAVIARPSGSQAGNAPPQGMTRDNQHSLNAADLARFGGIERTRRATSKSSDGRAVVNPRTACGRRLYGPQRFKSLSSNGADQDADSFVKEFSLGKVLRTSRCSDSSPQDGGMQIKPSPPSGMRSNNPKSPRNNSPKTGVLVAPINLAQRSVQFSETGRRKTLGSFPQGKSLSRFATGVAEESPSSTQGSLRGNGLSDRTIPQIARRKTLAFSCSLPTNMPSLVIEESSRISMN